MSKQAPEKTIVLGSEYDEKLRRALLVTLRELDGQAIDHSWDVAGSQELETLNVVVQGEAIAVQAETYIGLTIKGDPAIVDRIATRVCERMLIANS